VLPRTAVADEYVVPTPAQESKPELELGEAIAVVALALHRSLRQDEGLAGAGPLMT
jgi:hypothetical protein